MSDGQTQENGERKSGMRDVDCEPGAAEAGYANCCCRRRRRSGAAGRRAGLGGGAGLEAGAPHVPARHLMERLPACRRQLVLGLLLPGP